LSVFLNQSKDLILIKTTVIENNINQKYHIQLMKKENQITLRLDPTTDPLDKNSSVKNLYQMLLELLFQVVKTHYQSPKQIYQVF
jgi:hypothetical protein